MTDLLPALAPWITLAVIGLAVLALAREWLRPELVMLSAMAALLATGVLGPDEAFAGLSNSAVLAVASLYVVAAGVRATGALQFVDALIFPARPHLPLATGRLMLFTAASSAFLNNTPIVAMLIPRVQAWCEQHGISSSKLMIPLSYAAIVGGTTTLIGTSTNLLVAGLMESSGYEPPGLFDLAWIGVPATLVAMVYFLTLGSRLLPERANDDRQAEDGLKACAFEMRVVPGSPLVGKTLEDAGLRALGEAYVAHIQRDRKVLPSSPDTLLIGDDVLSFVGSASVLDRLLGETGLQPVQESVDTDAGQGLPLFEAVVAPGSSLVGRSLRDARFRERFQGVVLGIQRQDAAIEGPISRVPIQAGDLLVIEAKPGFQRRWNSSRDEFYLVAARGSERRSQSNGRAPLALGILFAVVAVAAAGWASIVTTAFLGALAMVAGGCISQSEARKSVDLNVLLVIVGALAIGAAMESSGLAGMLASLITGPGLAVGTLGVLLLVYFMTSLLTELITNNAAAALMLGIALKAAETVGAPPIAFGLTVAVAASASFITPIGYQTNLMVMAAGNYKFGDYARVGAGLSLLIGLTAVTMIGLVWL